MDDNSNSGFIQVPQVNSGETFKVLQANGGNEIEIKKNGYLYIYVSNESLGNVYFDDLRIEHTNGPLVEETHYYPFGLTMAGISSKAINTTPNKTKYQQYELNADFDINFYESFYRSHDPQLGRFWQIDPKPTDFESLYAAMGNNPIKNFDILGDSVPSTKQAYFPAPKTLDGFPDAGKRQYNKESGRYRWKLKDGTILEWDKQHGEVEKYDKTGKNHLGAFDPKTGEEIKGPEAGRSTAKFQGSALAAKIVTKAIPSFNPNFYVGGLSPTQPVTVTPEIEDGLKKVFTGLVKAYVIVKTIEVAVTVASGGILGWTLAF